MAPSPSVKPRGGSGPRAPSGEGGPGKGPEQHHISAKGNAYLDASFPKLTRITTARLVDAPKHEL